MLDSKTINTFRDKMKKYVPILLIVYIVLQPLLDTRFFYTDSAITILGMTIPTLVRILFIGLLCLFTLLTIKWNKKYWFLVAYGVLIVAYAVIHHINNMSFHSLVPGDFDYSLMSELFYIIRLLLPIALIFVTYHADLSTKAFRNTILILMLFIAGSIIVSNIFVISLGSYSNQPIKANIFSWFMGVYKNYTFADLASKAFFNFANQIAALFCMLLPLVFYFVISKPSVLSIVTILTQCIAMLMLGTRVSTYGSILILITLCVVWLYFIFIKKEVKFNLKPFLCISAAIFILITVLPKSPSVYREEIAGNTEEKYEDDTKNLDLPDDAESTTPENMQELTTFIKDNYEALHINEQFILRSYPYQYDPIFWYKTLIKPIEFRLDYRCLEISMVQRVKEINNNPLDTFFGIGYSRVSNIFNIERDFVNQYYSIGIVGVILFLGPYIGILLFGVYHCFRYYKKKFVFYNIALLASIALPLGVSYYSGNTMDALFVSTILGCICGILLKNIFDKTKDISDGNIDLDEKRVLDSTQ